MVLFLIINRIHKNGKESYWKIYHRQVNAFVEICNVADILALSKFF